MDGVKDRLGDLSWLGITDRCWVEVEVPDPIIDYKSIVDSQIEKLLQESLPMVETTNMTKSKRAEWLEYRKIINEIPHQLGYPKDVYWPPKPE